MDECLCAPPAFIQVSERELLGYINKRTEMEGDLVQLLRAIFQGLPSYTDKGKHIRGAVLHRVMWLIIKGRLTNKKAEEAVNALLPEVNGLAHTLVDGITFALTTRDFCYVDGRHCRRRFH